MSATVGRQYRVSQIVAQFPGCLELLIELKSANCMAQLDVFLLVDVRESISEIPQALFDAGQCRNRVEAADFDRNGHFFLGPGTDDQLRALYRRRERNLDHA